MQTVRNDPDHGPVRANVPYFAQMRRTPRHASIAAARAGGLAWLAAAAAVTAAPPTYRVETLGTDLQGFAMNELGDVVGRQVSTQNVGRAFLARRGGGVELLPTPAEWQSSDAYQVSNSGLVVGAVSTSSVASIGSRAAAWLPTPSGYQFRLLAPYPGDQFSTATAVNDHGDVVGGSGGLGLGMYPRAVRFTESGAQLLPDLALPADVNDERVVIAWNTMLDLDTMVATTVPLPPGNWQGVVSTNLAGSGAFCGYIAGFSGCSTFPVRWRPGIGWEFVGGCATTTSATSINDLGDVVAYVQGGGNWVSFVGEENMPIGPLVDPSQGAWAVLGASEINNARMILASARRGPAFSITELVRLVPIRLGDLNDDGFVDGTDLGMLLNEWGACMGTCPADLNDDGYVDGVDLGMMLGAWG